MNIQQKLIPTGTKRRSGNLIKSVSFIVAHDTGNAESTALQNVNYYINSANEDSASAHSFVDDLGVIECIPQTEKAWHVRYVSTKDNELFGMDSNDNALGIELCFFPKDIARTQKPYDNYVAYIAMLMKKYKCDPKTHIVGHYLLDPTRRTDPLNAFQYIKKDWLQFEQDLEDEMMGKNEPKVPETLPATPDIRGTTLPLKKECKPVISSEKREITLTSIIRDIISYFTKNK